MNALLKDRLRLALRDESGAVMVMAIAIMAIMVGLTYVVAESTNDGSRRVSADRSRSGASVGAETAVGIYQHLLNAALVDESDGYLLTSADVTKALDPAHGDRLATLSEIPLSFRDALTPVPAGHTAVPEPGGFPLTIAHCVTDCSPAGANSVYSYWQVVAIRPFDYSVSSTLTVWFRSWLGTTSVARAQYTKAEYRPGFFSDFQMLVNGPIAFTNDGSGGTRTAVVEGKVHSNGYDNGVTVKPTPGSSIWTEAGVGVDCPAGSSAKVTASTGSVDGISDVDCNISSGVVKPINFLQVGFALSQMHEKMGSANACTKALGSVRCFPSSEGGVTRHNVVLSGNTVTVNGVGYAVAGAATFLFPGKDVEVEGQTSARVTIAAEHVNGTTGGDIWISKDVGSSKGAGDADHLKAVLGLVAQGNIIVDIPQSSSCGATGTIDIHAALVAQTGALTLDPVKTTQNYQTHPNGASYARCTTERVTVEGSVAAQRAPLLRWEWTPGNWFGYAGRDYLFDSYTTVGDKESHLRLNPPPYYPHDGRWEVLSAADNNVDCLPNRTTTPAADGCGGG